VPSAKDNGNPQRMRNSKVGWKVVFVKEAWLRDQGLRDFSREWLRNQRESAINGWNSRRGIFGSSFFLGHVFCWDATLRMVEEADG